jgi:hypothetical protein
LRSALAILLVLAFAPAGARTEDPPQPEKPAGAPAGGEPAAKPAEPPEDEASARARERAAEEALEAELAAGVAAPFIQAGPAQRGRLTIASEVGWLRSGFRFDLGIAHGIDLVARLDTMLLYDVLGAQSGAYIGVRATPFLWSHARFSGELTIGQIFSPTQAETGTNTVLRAEATAGVPFGPALAYVRGAMRGIRVSPVTGSTWARDQELGVGLEARYRKLIGGAEWYALGRPRLDTLSQWRIRLGFAL